MSLTLIMPSGVKPSAEIVHAQRCGNCFYAEAIPQDPKSVFCKGGPPTAILIGMAQDALGRQQPMMNSFWPSLLKSSRRCALWASVDAEPGKGTQ